MRNANNWFEIPTLDLERAARFYESMLATTLHRERFTGTPMAIFPAEDPGVAGALILSRQRAPSADGSLVYLNCNGQLDDCLRRAVAAGGAVVQPRMDIGDPGFIAIVRDTEGNLVGLHSERPR